MDRNSLPDCIRSIETVTDNEYRTAKHALAYLAKADGIPHRAEGEAVLLSFVPTTARHILDLGTGDGRLLALLCSHCPDAKLDVQTQLEWLVDIGFADVDCYWKWLELALFGGVRAD